MKTYSTVALRQVEGMAGIISGTISKSGIKMSETSANPPVKKADFQLNIINRTKALTKAVEKLGGSANDLLTNSSNDNEYVTIKVTAFGFLAENLEKFASAGSVVDCVGQLTVSQGDNRNFVNFTANHIQLNANNHKREQGEKTTENKQATASQPAMKETVNEFTGYEESMDYNPDLIPF